MKVSLVQFLPFIMEKKLRGAVLYGYDEGLMQGLLGEMQDALSCSVMREEEALACPEIIGAPSLFAAPSAVTLIPNVTRSSAILGLLEGLPPAHILVWTTSENSAALTPFLSSAHVGVVACYECSAQESSSLLRRHAQKKALTFHPEAFALCAEWTRHGTWETCCQSLYLCQESPISSECIMALLEEPQQELVLLPLKPSSISIPPLSASEGLKLIRAWQRLFLQLGQLIALKSVLTHPDTLKRVSPPIFFKHTPFLIKAVPFWPIHRLAKSFQNLAICEIELKKNPNHSQGLLACLLKTLLSDD